MTRLISIFKSMLLRTEYLLVMLVLVGCTTTPVVEKAASYNDTVILAQSGIGGTGIQLNEANEKSHLNGGIGGTGSKVAQDGGIGGTGIVGALTKVAKNLRVGNIEIKYDGDVPITVNGKPAKVDHLLVGQIAVIHAQKIDDQVIAQNIAVNHAAVGPIEQINRDDSTLIVLNQTIRMHKEIPVAEFEVGQWVQVSGYRTGTNVVMATRVDHVHSNHVAKIYGNVTQILSDNKFLINDTLVVTEKPIPVAPGAEISVYGQWVGSHLELKQAWLNPIRHYMGQVSDIVVEGFWDAISRNWEVDLEKYKVSRPGVVESIVQNEMVTVSGTLNKAQHIIVNALNIQKIIELERGYEFDIFDDLLTDSYANSIDFLDDTDLPDAVTTFGSTAIDDVPDTATTGEFLDGIDVEETLEVIPE